MNLSEKWRDSQPPPQPVRRRFRAQDFEDSVINERAEEQKARPRSGAAHEVVAPRPHRITARAGGSWLNTQPQGRAIVQELRRSRTPVEAEPSDGAEPEPPRLHRVGWIAGGLVLAACAVGAMSRFFVGS